MAFGSIGSGKTQATSLPIFRQLLAFRPFPSFLVLDPKGTLIKEGIQILGETGNLERALHMRLGGKVKFNPIYVKNPLRNGKFVEIAQMIRAASVNLSGKSSEPFWEDSGFNMVRNALVATHLLKGYYTLNDLYEVMTSAASGTLDKDLDEHIKRHGLDRYNFEEKANIQFAVNYFKDEYRNLDDKIRSGILATTTSFLNQFQEFQASEVFCPKEDEPRITSMDEVIDNGYVLFFDIRNSGLSKSMGTFVKLHYQTSVLARVNHDHRRAERHAVLFAEEFQDFVTVGKGGLIGDQKFQAQGRECRAITVAVTQSMNSLKNAVSNESGVKELVQNFRTRIFGQSSDLDTVNLLQQLVGKEMEEVESSGLSEFSVKAKKNYMLGGFDSQDSNIVESRNTSLQKDYVVTGKELSRLKTFEAFVQFYDGTRTRFEKLFLKPDFLEKKDTSHKDVLEILEQGDAKEKLRKFAKGVVAGFVLSLAMASLTPMDAAYAFPNVCSAVKSPDFRSCLNLQVSTCMCGFPIPRPCARISYYVPQTFIEVVERPKSTFFKGLPGVTTQIGSIGDILPMGSIDNDGLISYHAHTIPVPLAWAAFSQMQCGGTRVDKMCFDGMSEHFGSHWKTGSGDLLQPRHLLWRAAPKLCLLKGAATSITGNLELTPNQEVPMCSVPVPKVASMQPSSYPACTGWGEFYPRYGSVTGISNVVGALQVGARIKNLSVEVLRSMPQGPDEKWQMIYPQKSACFREGQNAAILELPKRVNELGRMSSGRLNDFLFVVWKKVSCCRDLATVPVVHAAIAAMQVACQGVPSK